VFKSRLPHQILSFFLIFFEVHIFANTTKLLRILLTVLNWQTDPLLLDPSPVSFDTWVTANQLLSQDTNSLYSFLDPNTLTLNLYSLLIRKIDFVRDSDGDRILSRFPFLVLTEDELTILQSKILLIATNQSMKISYIGNVVYKTTLNVVHFLFLSIVALVLLLIYLSFITMLTFSFLRVLVVNVIPFLRNSLMVLPIFVVSVMVMAILPNTGFASPMKLKTICFFFLKFLSIFSMIQVRFFLPVTLGMLSFAPVLSVA